MGVGFVAQGYTRYLHVRVPTANGKLLASFQDLGPWTAVSFSPGGSWAHDETCLGSGHADDRCRCCHVLVLCLDAMWLQFCVPVIQRRQSETHKRHVQWMAGLMCQCPFSVGFFFAGSVADIILWVASSRFVLLLLLVPSWLISTGIGNLIFLVLVIFELIWLLLGGRCHSNS